MRRCLFLLSFFLAWPAFAGDIDLPSEVKGKPGTFIRVPATTKGAVVRWLAFDEGLNVFPVDLLKDTKTAVVVAAQPGKFRIGAWTAIDGVPTEAAVTTILVEGPAPPPVPPTPPVPPIPPIPIPTGFRALFVFESADEAKMPAAQLSILTSTKIRQYLNEKAKGYRFIDKDTDLSKDDETWRKIWEASKSTLPALPALVLISDQKGEAFPLPTTEADTLALLKKYGG